MRRCEQFANDLLKAPAIVRKNSFVTKLIVFVIICCFVGCLLSSILILLHVHVACSSNALFGMLSEVSRARQACLAAFGENVQRAQRVLRPGHSKNTLDEYFSH